MDKFYRFIKDILKLSYTEARGFTQLLFVCLAVSAFYMVSGFFIPSDPATNPEDIRTLDSLVAVFEQNSKPDKVFELFPFDPNNISKDSLLLLGLPVKVADRYINYLATGARFSVKEDLKKIYGIPDSLIRRLYPFIDLPERVQDSAPVPFDLNKVSADRLAQLELIDESTAGRIAAYRNLLGGFTAGSQLYEVYGLSDKAADEVLRNGYINSDFRPRRMSINRAEKNTLRAHPYISDALAEDIILFREVNGTIKSETVLADFKSIDTSKFELLILYLDFE